MICYCSDRGRYTHLRATRTYVRTHHAYAQRYYAHRYSVRACCVQQSIDVVAHNYAYHAASSAGHKIVNFATAARPAGRLVPRTRGIWYDVCVCVRIAS